MKSVKYLNETVRITIDDVCDYEDVGRDCTLVIIENINILLINNIIGYSKTEKRDKLNHLGIGLDIFLVIIQCLPCKMRAWNIF